MSLFFFSSRRRHTRLQGDWSSDVCSSDLVAVERAAQSLASILRGRQMWYGKDPAEREGNKQISRADHFPDLCNGPELFVIMDDIARNHTDDARLQNKRGLGAGRSNARIAWLGCIATLTLVLIALAIATPRVGRAAPDSAPDTTNPHPHKHRHKPTPAPTPMALPPEVKAKVSTYNPALAPFHDGEELTYQASWLGIPAAEARVRFRKKIKDPSRQNQTQKDPAQKDQSR